MKLTPSWDAKVIQDGETATFTFRTPTNKELSEFINDIMGTGKNVTGIREAFFDSLLTGVDNLDGLDKTPITVKRTGEIPVNWKAMIVSRRFEIVTVKVSEKN
jgi:hypothetical protein